MRAQRAGGTRPQALLSPATLCHSDIIATALSPARVGPAHMHSSRVRHYVTCDIIATVRHYVALLYQLFT